jgi:hypothetical protein
MRRVVLAAGGLAVAGIAVTGCSGSLDETDALGTARTPPNLDGLFPTGDEPVLVVTGAPATTDGRSASSTAPARAASVVARPEIALADAGNGSSSSTLPVIRQSSGVGAAAATPTTVRRPPSTAAPTPSGPSSPSAPITGSPPPTLRPVTTTAAPLPAPTTAPRPATTTSTTRPPAVATPAAPAPPPLPTTTAPVPTTAAPAEGRISGTISLAAGTVRSDLTLVRSGSDVRSVSASDDRSFSFPALAPGEYTLVLERWIDDADLLDAEDILATRITRSTVSIGPGDEIVVSCSLTCTGG